MANEEEKESQCEEWIMMADLVQCLICFKSISKAKVLPNCKHVFCFDCLLRYWEDSTDSSMKVVLCPVCRVHCPLPEEGLSGLPSDIKASKLGEMLRQCVVLVNKEQKTTDSATGTGTGVATPPCDVCNLDTEKDPEADPSHAIRHCEDCGNYLCELCSQKHDDTSVFSKHKIIDLVRPVQDTQILCSKHPGKKLQYICNTCPSVACSVCVTTQHSAGHNVIEMKELMECRKTETKKLLQHIRKMSKGFDNRNALTEELVMKTKDIYWDVAKKISDHADQCRREVDEAENHLLEELELKKNEAIQLTREEGKKRKYNIEELDTLNDFASNFLSTATPLAFIANCDSMLEKIRTILKSRDKGIQVDLKGVGVTFIIQQGLLSLGRLQDESASTMTLAVCPKKTSPMFVELSASRSPCKISSDEKRSQETSDRAYQEGVENVHIQETHSERVGREFLRANETKEIVLYKHRERGRRGDHLDRKDPRPRHSTSSSNEGDYQFMAHSGHHRFKRPKGRSSSLNARKKDNERERRNSAQTERTEQYPRHSRRSNEEEERRGRPTSMMVIPQEEILQIQEVGESAKLLWEHNTADEGEGEPVASRPRDVAFLPNGDIYLLNDKHHSLVHFTADGETNQIISDDFTSPMRIVVTSDEQLAVSDAQEHCIKLFSLDGTTHNVWNLENMMPSGMAITEDGKWLILDKVGDLFGIFPEVNSKCENQVILTKHLVYTERYIACDSKGKVYVSGSEDTTIAVFDLEGTHLMDVGGAGSLGGYVSVPRGLYVDNQDNLIVADRHNHRVSMFNSEGRFTKHIITCPFEKVIWPTAIDFVTLEDGQTRMAVTISETMIQVYDVSNII